MKTPLTIGVFLAKCCFGPSKTLLRSTIEASSGSEVVQKEDPQTHQHVASSRSLLFPHQTAWLCSQRLVLHPPGSSEAVSLGEDVKVFCGEQKLCDLSFGGAKGGGAKELFFFFFWGGYSLSLDFMVLFFKNFLVLVW